MTSLVQPTAAKALDAIQALPQPVIAAVQGHCYTGSLELALACDLIVAAESAKFSDTHGKWAMSPTWGMSQRLPRRVGVARAKELMFRPLSRIASALSVPLVSGNSAKILPVPKSPKT